MKNRKSSTGNEHERFEQVIQSIVEFGHLHILETFYKEHQQSPPSVQEEYNFNTCLNQAVIYGRMEIVKWLYDRISPKYRTHIVELCCSAIDHGQREIFQWLYAHQGGAVFTTYFLVRCVQQRQEHILEWLLATDVDRDRDHDHDHHHSSSPAVVVPVTATTEEHDDEIEQSTLLSALFESTSSSPLETLYDHVACGRTMAIEKMYSTMPAILVQDIIPVHETIILLAAEKGHAPVLEWVHDLGFLRVLDHPRATILTAIEHGRINVLDYMLVICPSSFDDCYIEFILAGFKSGHLPVLQWCYDHISKMDERFFDQFGNEVIEITARGQFLHVFTWLENIAGEVFPRFTALVQEIPLKKRVEENWKMIKRSTVITTRRRSGSDSTFAETLHSSTSTSSTVTTASPSTFMNIMALTAAASTIVNNVTILSSSPVVKTLQYWILKR